MIFSGKKFKTAIILIFLILLLAGAGFYIFDQVTKIEWSNRSLDRMNWPKAIDYCRNLNEGGHSDWRLPDIDELRTLIKNCPKTETGGECRVSEKNGCLHEKCWKNPYGSCYCERKSDIGYYSKLGDENSLWSYSSDSFLTSYAWCVDFEEGYVFENNRFSKHHVRCVRDGFTQNSQKATPADDLVYEYPVVMGNLDKSVIKDAISEHWPDIRSCYEKELKNNPKLIGKIAVKFVISATGTVKSSKVQGTTLENEAVESCVADQIKKIQFPAPKDGGVVIVTYPFLLLPRGSIRY